MYVVMNRYSQQRKRTSLPVMIDLSQIETKVTVKCPRGSGRSTRTVSKHVERIVTNRLDRSESIFDELLYALTPFQRTVWNAYVSITSEYGRHVPKQTLKRELKKRAKLKRGVPPLDVLEQTKLAIGVI